MRLPDNTPYEYETTSTKAQPHWKVAAAALALVGVGVGFAGGELVRRPVNYPSASTLEKALNSDAHVAQQAVVEVGYAIPLTTGQGPEGAIAITNPIRLGKDTYGYIDPSLQQDGTVTIDTVQYGGPLQRNAYFGGYNKAYAHEVTTPLSIIYSDAPGEGKSDRYYTVTMSSTSGDGDSLMNYAPNIDQGEHDRERAEEWGQIEDASVGSLTYDGKVTPGLLA